MIIYSSMFIISLIFAYLSTRVENKYEKAILFFFAFVPFFIVSAIRYDVGTDYFYRYVPNYKTFVSGGEIKSLEILFRLLIKGCVLISKDYAILFITSSAIIVGLIMGTIYKNSKQFVLSVAILFLRKFLF